MTVRVPSRDGRSGLADRATRAEDPSSDDGARILMVAPEPFFRPRGTPFSVLHRIRGLSELGHRVHLVTYPFGESPTIPGLVVDRAAGVPGIRDVPIGPSIPKLFLDLPLFRKADRLARDGGFDLLHTHEEAAVMGGWISERHGLPHLYDMHSSLPEQIGNFDRFNLPPVVALFRRMERYALARSDGVIAISRSLADHARAVGYGGPVEVIENVMAGTGFEPSDQKAHSIRCRFADPGTPLVVYAGSLEPYQGIDLLPPAVKALDAVASSARFLVVGGTDPQVEAARRQTREHGVEDRFSFVGTVPADRVQAYLGAADVLISPRRTGTNPPLKIYEYMRSGKPIVATDIPAHTQVLDATTSELVAPDPGGIASGVARLIADPDRARRLARSARRTARDRYSEAAYLKGLASILSAVGVEG